MANKIVLQLEAAEKVAVARRRNALLLAQIKVNDVKQKAEADYKAAVDDAQAKSDELVNKLKSFARAAKVDGADIRFDFEKYHFYTEEKV